MEILPEVERSIRVAVWLATALPAVQARVLPDAPLFFGYDFGRTGDLSALWLVQRLDGCRLSVRAVVELRNCPHRVQEAVLFALVDCFPRLLSGAMDARGNGSYLAEAATQRWGTRVDRVMLSQGWYADHMPPFKAALEDGTLGDLPADPDVTADLRQIRVDKGIAKVPEGAKTRGADGAERHGDSAMAAALAHYASRRGGAPIEFKSSGVRRVGAHLREWEAT